MEVSVKLKRKLYTRGSSFETTIPMPLLFALDKKKKHHVVFDFDSEKNRWYISFEKSVEESTESEEDEHEQQ